MLHLKSNLRLNLENLPFVKKQVDSMEYGVTWQQKPQLQKTPKDTNAIVGITRQKSSLLRWSLPIHVLGHASSEVSF